MLWTGLAANYICGFMVTSKEVLYVELIEEFKPSSGYSWRDLYTYPPLVITCHILTRHAWVFAFHLPMVRSLEVHTPQLQNKYVSVGNTSINLIHTSYFDTLYVCYWLIQNLLVLCLCESMFSICIGLVKETSPNELRLLFSTRK